MAIGSEVCVVILNTRHTFVLKISDELSREDLSMKKNTYISPLAIDLGGKNTGVYMVQYQVGEDPANSHKRASVLVMPEEGGRMTYSQVKRTATRHRIRGNKRRKMAKRLLRLVIEKALKLHPDNKQWERLNGFLNRRGYNRIVIDSDSSVLENCPPDYFSEIWPDHFNSIDSLANQFDSLLQKPEDLRKLKETDLFNMNKRDFSKKLPEDLDKEEKRQITGAYEMIVKDVANLLTELDFGHYHRKDYLSAIRKDLLQDESINSLIVGNITQDELTNIIGHISNMQLRTLRWYFNNKKMYENDLWLPEKLHEVFERWIAAWHPGEQEKSARKLLLDELKSNGDIVDIFKKINPELSIPPYEDQNNRRPPKDQTLWLSPSALDRKFPKWRIWAHNLERHNHQLKNGLPEQLMKNGKPLCDRKTRPETEDRVVSYFLHRLLDRTSTLDPYSLRLLAKGYNSHSSQMASESLAMQLGEQHVDEFLGFARAYYQEVENAKQGIWIPSEDSLLERADINPPHKSSILYQLVGNLLGVTLSAQELELFRRDLWTARVSGNSTLRGLCGKVEEIRKNWGNLFNEKLSRLEYRVENKGAKPKKDFNAEEKEVWGAREKSQQATDAIARYFSHSDKQKARYANTFSISQLYNLLERDRYGFSSSSLAAHQENAWRMQQVDVTENGSAKSFAACSRLPADSVRPFDGVLRRALERQAWEISRMKADQILEGISPNSEIVVPILIEENRFSFSLGIGDLKKNKKNRDRVTRLLNRQTEQWEEKDNRIARASKGICPYTGDPLTEEGEIDHILPRSASLKVTGTIYNAEANLIYCSRGGNQRKGDMRYRLGDLDERYLDAQFNTRDRKAISETIENSVSTLGSEIFFTDLDVKIQRDLRHALFLDDSSMAYQKAVKLLANQQKARVNGTQAWLIKRVMSNIDKQLLEQCKSQGISIRYIAARINAQEVSSIRRRLSSLAPHLSKGDVQSVSSHAIDALCVLAAACDNPDTASQLKLPQSGLSEDLQWLMSMMPSGINIPMIERKPKYQKRNISGQPLFKETIYAEHFVPVWLRNGELWVGFSLEDNAIKMEKGDPAEWLELLRPFLRYRKSTLEHETQYWLNESRVKPLYLTIEKTTAFEHLHAVAIQEADDRSLRQADILDGLRYVTLKKNIQDAVYDVQKKKFYEKDEILKDTFFKLKLDFRLGGTSVGYVKGKLELPVYSKWLSLLEDFELAAFLGDKADVGDKFWKDLYGRYFKDTICNGGKHQKARRVYSLPVLPTLAGEVFRVTRRRSGTGEKVFQLIPAEGTSSAGFESDGGVVNFNKSSQIEHFRVSKNISVPGSRFGMTKEVVHFNEWRSVDVVYPFKSIDICPGSKGRAYIRLTQPFEGFRCWLEQAVDNAPQSPYELASEIKLDKPKFYDAHRIELLGTPRSNLFVTDIGEDVTYWYIANGTNSAMKQAYNSGKPKGM